MLAANMDYDSLKKAGSAIGSAAVIVMDDTTDMVRVLERLSRFYYMESCGSARPAARARLAEPHAEADPRGQGRREDVDMLVSVANNIEATRSARSRDAAAWPVQSFVKHFRQEFEHYVEHGCSLVAARGQAA